MFEGAATGLESLGQGIDEPGSSIEETLAEMLQRLGDSYNPKKRRTQFF
jgi:hypothetical protein